MPKQEEYPVDKVDNDQATSMTLIAIRSLAFVTIPFLFFRAGVDSPGWFGLICFLGIPIWGLQSHSALVLVFFKWWVAALVIYKLSQSREESSHSVGYPWLTSLFFKDYKTACLATGALVLAFGYYYVADRGMKYLLMASGGSLIADIMVTMYVDYRAQIAYTNARNAMKYHVRKFKS